MNKWTETVRMLREKLRRYPDQTDVLAVREMTAKQWRGISQRTETYMLGYRDAPTSLSRAQLRARWLAKHGVFMDAKNVMELGCGCGRNLAELRRKYVDLGVIGVDINADAIRECKSTLPAKSIFTAANLYDMLLSPVYAADVIFTVGVLGHLERTGAERLVSWMRHRARQAVVLVEEPGFGTIAKGPASWDALKSTGDYVLWRHNFDTMIGPSVRSIENLPQHLQAPAATTLYVLRPA